MKIPFERTVASAYSFAFRNILSVIGIAWFPYLLLSAAIGALVHQFGPQFLHALSSLPEKADPKANPAEVFAMFRLIWSAYAVTLPLLFIVSCMVTVGVMRKALGITQGPVFFFFSLGGQVWRLVGAYFLLGLAAYFGLLVGVGVVFGIWYAINQSSPGWAVTAAVVLGIALFCFWIYALVRTAFFLPAVVVAEGRIGLGRSWQLGGRNFWRIIGIALVIYLPVSIAAQVILSSVFQMTILPMVQPGASAPQQFHDVVKLATVMITKAGPYFAIVQVAQMIVIHGLRGGAVASAYQAVTDTKAAA